jgi:iron complex outermembrane receptor protein
MDNNKLASMKECESLKVRFLQGLIFLWIPCMGLTAEQSPEATEMDELLELSLEELLDVEVTSVSRKAERRFDAAAAVHVITSEDIRRSGVTSLPEALRLAPGVQVARIDANRWAISIRGFNSRFANKLLVLIDGRTLYSPFFSGVYWDVQDTVLEDIDRIEVIRGPGATLWGANAVNGIINVMTKSAQDTQGTLISAGIGNEERSFAALRYGNSLGDDAFYRVYAKFFNRDGAVVAATDRDAKDEWQQWRGGFRLDWEPAEQDEITVQGEVYRGNSGEQRESYALTTPFVTVSDGGEDVQGGHILGRWDRQFSLESDLALQLYYDHNQRETVNYDVELHTVDVDFQHRFPLAKNHKFLWGLGVRYYSDEVRNTFTLSFGADKSTFLWSGFVQDEITLLPDQLRLTVGSKFEHNSYTGLEIQPNLRLLWTPHNQHTVWAAVSRAVRTPSRLERDFVGNLVSPPGAMAPGAPPNPFPAPLVLRIAGDEDINSEELIAYELGYRFQVTPNLLLDFAGFYNDYDELRSAEPSNLVCEPSGIPVTAFPPCFLTASNILLPIVSANRLEGETFGVEATVDWELNRWWDIQAAYSYLQVDLRSRGDSMTRPMGEGSDPSHQLSLLSSLDLPQAMKLDLWLRYVDDLPELDVDSYIALDGRLAWQPKAEIELSLVGQNLLDNRHVEFRSNFYPTPLTQIERSVYFKLTFAF